MRHATGAALLTAVLVLLAGCTMGLGGPGAGPTDGGDPGSQPTGSVAFYLSDQPTAIGDFAHLNVTVTQVGFHPRGAGNETNGTPTTPPTVVGSPNQTATATAENDSEDEFGGWILQDVDNRTVDLTTLVGDNATQIAGVELPAGEYNGVFVWVAETSGTLTDGTEVDVKLPSQRLLLNTQFAVESNSSVDFVFDIAVHETGNGRYVLRPVISESGTDVPIEPVDGDGRMPVDATQATDRGPDDPGNGSQGQGQGQGG